MFILVKCLSLKLKIAMVVIEYGDGISLEDEIFLIVKFCLKLS